MRTKPVGASFGTVRAFPRDPKQPVLVHVRSERRGQLEAPVVLEPLEMLEHPAGTCRRRGSAQPVQPAGELAVPTLEQRVEPDPVIVGQPRDEASVERAVGARDRPGAGPIDDVEPRHHDPPAPERLERVGAEPQPLVALQRDVDELAHEVPEGRQPERLHPEVGQQLAAVLVPRFVACGVAGPGLDVDPQGTGHPVKERVVDRAVGGERDSGVAQQAELDGKAEAVGVPTSLAHECHIGLGQRVDPDPVGLLGWQREQYRSIRGRQR